MTVPFNADAYAAVLPGGTVTFTQTFETSFGSNIPQPVSAVTVQIASADGVSDPVVGPTSAGLAMTGTATYGYTWACPAVTSPDLYLVTFTGTGPNGQIVYTQAVTVAEPPELSPAPGVYCTVAQYQAEIGDQNSPQWLLIPALRTASMVIDRALIGAIYQVDANSMPIDPGVMTVLTRATAYQAQFQLADDDATGVKRQYSSRAFGGATASRATGTAGAGFPPLAPMAALTLQNAGALPGAPLLGW